jgi:hypothetical protein
MADRSKNTRNPNAQLFRKLTRLLSGPLTNYRRQTPRQLRRIQLDKYKFQSAGGLSFKKTEYNPFAGMQSNYLRNQNRGDRYVDFDQMEYTPEIASTLDIYADEMTTSTNLNPLLVIDCSNEEIKSILETLYHNILNAEFNLFGWCRTMCKYGDYFLYLDIDETQGITNVIGLPPVEIERLEGEDKSNPNYVQFQWNSGGLTFENWQIAHFRILGNDKYAPYGTSIMEPARRIWRQLILLEDAMMAYRIVRSPERRVFYIDVGNIGVEDVDQYMQKVVTQMKRNQVIDPSTGRVDLRYNPMSIDEDYFIPVRGGSSSKIDTLAGGTYTGDIEDVKYLRDKLFSALKIPQSYLSRGDGAEEDKGTLAQKDIRFARTIQRLQRAVTAELEKIGVIHLYTLGFREYDLVSFDIRLANPSKLAELQEIDHWKAKFDAAATATEGFFSKRWIAKKLFNLSDEEIVRNQREMFFDAKFNAQLEVIAQEAVMPSPGGGGLPPMDDTGMPPPLPEEEIDLENAPLDASPGSEEDSVLLPGSPDEGAPPESPGKRDTVNTAKWHKVSATDVTGKNVASTTRAAKGKWHKPGAHDKRSAGARKRSVASITGLEPLGHGIYEQKETTYNNEEERVFRINREVKVLLEGLEKKDKTEQS